MTPLRAILHRFIFDMHEPVMVDGSGITPDPELAARNAARIEAAKQQLGDKWICHNVNAEPKLGSAEQYWPSTHDLSKEELEALLEDEAQTYAAHSHTEGR